jgi:Phosphotransferase enzyme family
VDEPELPLPGGNVGGAARVGDTVRRAAGPWTAAVHHLLRHLQQTGFARAPRPLGIDEQGREVLTYLPGRTIGDSTRWPRWVYTDDALVQTARWMRDFHSAVADFRPPPGTVWRLPGTWREGLIVGHNDVAPYNAAWTDDGLSGFFDWDFAGPVSAEWDLAYAAFSWVPLHARHVVAQEGFTAFDDRPRRLQLFLDVYGWVGPMPSFVHTVQKRARALAALVRAQAAAGDPTFVRMVSSGTARGLDAAVRELDGFT